MFDYATPAGGTPVTQGDRHLPVLAGPVRVERPARRRTTSGSTAAPARATEGGTQQATTVVIQYVKQYDSGFGDQYGGRTPKEETIGTGKGIVLRDGQSWPVTWSRSSRTDGTTFTGADGQVVPFAPGPGVGRAGQQEEAGRRRALTPCGLEPRRAAAAPAPVAHAAVRRRSGHAPSRPAERSRGPGILWQDADPASDPHGPAPGRHPD